MKPNRLAGGVPPTYDLSVAREWQIVIEPGDREYQGHPTTVLLPDGATVYCVWTVGHGGPCGPLKRSFDQGKMWSGMLPVPDDWRQCVNCPTIWHLPVEGQPNRLAIYAQEPQTRAMRAAFSPDGGGSWTPMQPCGPVVSVMPWTAIVPVSGGRLLGLTNARREANPAPQSRTNVLIQSYSDDHGATWQAPRVIADIADSMLCEPWLIPSPDGRELACLIRDNNRERNSWIMFTRDEGETWTEPVQLPDALTGDRHIARYLPDGRILAVFRDVCGRGPTPGHFCGWLGTYEDLKHQRPGQARFKLLHHHPVDGALSMDCGYPGLEVFADGTALATTYLHYRETDAHNALVAVRFNLSDIDFA